jgi:hypothetical protein
VLARLLLLALLGCLLAVAPAASAQPPPIDDYAYDPAKECRKRPTPGALALVEWLELNSSGVSWGIMRCEKWGRNRASLHAEGRAVDWHLDAARPADRREARRLIDILLAADDAGNRDHIHFGLSWAGARKRTSFWRAPAR